MFLSGPIPEAEEPPAPQTDLDRILADPVLQYRCKRLLDAGLTLHQSRALALDNRVDMHFVTERLVGRGCPPHLAFDIASFA